MKKKKKSILERLEDLEYIVYKKHLKKCPRCGKMGMNLIQEGVCGLCAYVKGDVI